MASEAIPLETVNLMDSAKFVEVFGGVAEDAAWVAEQAAGRRPYANREAMIAAFQAEVGEAGVDRQHALLQAHPDLAGRAAVAGDLSAESAREQAGAGLDRLSREEFAHFSRLNETYRSRFGFPFILAVRGATKVDILAAFEARVENDAETELVTALEQVCHIVRFRIEERVAA